MAHDPLPPTDVLADVPPANLQLVLDAGYPAIEEAIEDFLLQRGGAPAATQRLRVAMAALRRHIYLEEEFLFPPLRAAGMVGPVHAMSADHHELWNTLDRVTAGLDEPASWEAQRTSCRILHAELDRHTSKENPIVFGRAETMLAPAQQAVLRDLVETVSMPPGWTCPDPVRS